MGQVQVTLVRSDLINDVFAALNRAGFNVTTVAANTPHDTQAVRCCRGDRVLELHLYPDSDPAGSLIVNGHPPYSIWPWRWLGDIRMFNDVTIILDKFAARE